MESKTFLAVFALLFVGYAGGCSSVTRYEPDAGSGDASEEAGVDASGDAAVDAPADAAADTAADASPEATAARLFFIVDGSTSMLVSDGGLARRAAVVEAIAALEAYDEARIGAHFSGGIDLCVPFGEPQIETVDFFAETGGTFDLASGTECAAVAMSNEANEMDEGLRPNARFDAVIITDGAGEDDDMERALYDVDQALRLRAQHGLLSVRFHAVFVRPAADPQREAAASLLRDIAEAGGGEFRDYLMGEPIDFL